MQDTTLARFAEKQEKLMIYYLDREGKLTQRIIKVLRCNEAYLLGYCYYRKRIRTFKLGNILTWEKISGKDSA